MADADDIAGGGGSKRPGEPGPPKGDPPRGLLRRRGPLRRTIFICILTICVLLGAVFVSTRGPIAAKIAESRIRAALNVDVKVDRARIGLDGAVHMVGVTLSVPGHAGIAADFLEVPRISARIGAGRLTSMDLYDPVVRISESLVNGTLNIESVPVPTRRGTPGVFEIPSVRVHGVMIELGEHDATRYRSLARVLADGELTRAPDEGYTISLIERAGGRLSPLRFDGTIVAEELEIRTSSIDLSRWPASSMPPSIRGAMELLSLDGVVDSAEFTLTREAGPNLKASVARVGVTLPFAATEGGPLIRMRDVNGRIELRPRGVEATLDGLFEDLRYTVTLNYEGIDANAPFQAEMRATNFRLESRPALLPFVPRLVVERLELFSNPTADLDATVTIQRRVDDLGVIGPVEVGGWLQVRNGTASFRDFPYPFERMEGIVLFDSDRIEIRRLSGRSASGATMFASGVIGPPTDSAEVDIRVEVEHAPLDDLMKEALGTRGDIVSQLIDDEHEAELRARGLLGEGEAAFSTGGVSDIEVRVRRELGKESIWTTEVKVRFDELRLVPRAFPIPLIARGVLIDVYNNDARVTGEHFSSLAGGDAQIAIDLDLSDGGASPDVRVGAREVPAGPLLEYAVVHSGAARPGAEEGERAALARLLPGMNLRGLVDASVSVGERDDGSIGVDAWIDLAGLVAEVGRAGALAGVVLREVNGSVVVTETDATVDIFARAFKNEEPAGDLDAKALVRFPRELPEALVEAQMDARSLELGLPLDRAARVFSPEAGEALAAAIERLRPSGRADVALRYRSADPDTPELSLSRPEDVSILTPFGRVAFSGERGTLRVLPGQLLGFEAFDATITHDGEIAAEVRLDGRYPMGDPNGERGEGVSARIAEARVESGLFRAILQRVFGARAAELYDALDPAGRFNGLLRISPPSDPDADPVVTGRVEPKRLAFDREGRRVILTEIEGAIELFERGLRLSGLAFQGVGWSGELAGEVRAAEDGPTRADARLRVDAESLSGDLLAVVPGMLRERIDAIDGVIEGPLSLDLQEFGVELDGSDSPPFSAAGTLEFDRARAEVGVELREATGRLAFEIRDERDERGNRRERFQIDAFAPTARLSGIGTRNISAQIVSGSRPGSIRLERFSADCHGGRIGADALIETSDGGRRAYTASIRLSDVRLAPVLADLGAVGEPPESLTAQLGDPPDGSRGLISAELSLGGWVGTTRGRRGRGVAQVGAGPVLELPLLGRLIEVSNLQLPRSGRFDLAILGFFVENDRVTFDELSIFTETVEVFGYGTMDWPTRELDLRLASRAVRPIPLLSPIVEQFRDELIVARVVGPVDSTRIVTEPLPGTRDLIRRLLGREPSAEERRLLDLRERMEQNRALARRVGDRARRTESSDPDR
ncbi:MAG: hypothetical protein EA423_06110 [Phycisphaerales bacterium]|nr:MAG: hypothetical protein EA423_06110 [Phycisphaerales bacterium]